jgi:hypothetical protein
LNDIYLLFWRKVRVGAEFPWYVDADVIDNLSDGVTVTIISLIRVVVGVFGVGKLGK